MTQEVDKLLVASFIRELMYHIWLASIMMVKKSNDKWRICVDFTNLNKVCLKDSYHFSKIDCLVDATTGFKYLSSLNVNSRYHQISIHLDDKEKTAFITKWGTYWYREMSFRLKNVGATYQWIVNKIFKNWLGRNIEGYVNGMLVKSMAFKQHLLDLEEVFFILSHHQMKLNPFKCVFAIKE